jgi:hypothetical protein
MVPFFSLTAGITLIQSLNKYRQEQSYLKFSLPVPVLPWASTEMF